MAQERPHFSYLLKQFASGYTQKLLAANLPQHDAVICPVQLREKTFKKICHERSESRGQRARRRSEEHTSELQSPVHLVCRLLLEKKNTCREPRPLAGMTSPRTTPPPLPAEHVHPDPLTASIDHPPLHDGHRNLSNLLLLFYLSDA